MKSQTHTNLIIRSIIALALTVVIWLPVQAISAESMDETMMNHTDGGNMMNQTYGWMWVWTVVSILVVVLLVAIIIKLFKK